MKTVALALTFGAVCASLALSPGSGGSVPAASAAEPATVAAQPKPTPAIGFRHSVGDILPPLPGRTVPSDAILLIGFRHSVDRSNSGASDFKVPATAWVFGKDQLPTGIASTKEDAGATSFTGPGSQYVRFEHTVSLTVPAQGTSVTPNGTYDLLLVQQPSTTTYCWIMSESLFSYKPIADFGSGEPGTITQRDGGSDEFVVTGYPVNTGYCKP